MIAEVMAFNSINRRLYYHENFRINLCPEAIVPFNVKPDPWERKL
jgi:hypothetical protein